MCFDTDETKQGECAQMMRGLPDNFAAMLKMMEQYCRKTGCSAGRGRMMKDMDASCCGFAAGGNVKNSDGEEKE